MTKYIKVEKCELHTCPYFAFKMSKSLGIDVIYTLTGQQIEDITKEFPPICPLKEVVEC
jgi:hypothetical protein